MRSAQRNATNGTMRVSSTGTAADHATAGENERWPAPMAIHTGHDMNAITARRPTRIAKPGSSCCCCMLLPSSVLTTAVLHDVGDTIVPPATSTSEADFSTACRRFRGAGLRGPAIERVRERRDQGGVQV